MQSMKDLQNSAYFVGQLHMFVANTWQKRVLLYLYLKHKRKDHLKWQCLRQNQLWKLNKDLCASLLSLEGEDVDSVILWCLVSIV